MKSFLIIWCGHSQYFLGVSMVNCLVAVAVAIAVVVLFMGPYTLYGGAWIT